MRVESFSVGTQSLQNSDNNRLQTESKTVVQASNEIQEVNPEEVSVSKVETAVKKMNDFIEPLRTNLKFQFHEELHEYYVTIVNPNTDEVIKEIPPKKMLDMYAAMAEYMGFLIDRKI
jgi:flagellar protein FlaG